MAKVEWADAIKTVSGALVRINKKSPHAADQKMVLGTHRVAPSTNPDCSRIYLRGLSSITRTSPLTSKEQKQRARFAFVANKVKLRSKDLSQISDDQAAFIAQKDAPNGKKTMKAYLWSLELATYDSEHAND